MMSIERIDAPPVAAVRSHRQYSVDYSSPLPPIPDDRGLAARLRRATFKILVDSGARCFTDRDMEWSKNTPKPDLPERAVFVTAKHATRAPQGMREVCPSSLAPHLMVQGSWPSFCVTKAIEEYFMNETFTTGFAADSAPVCFLVYFDSALRLATPTSPFATPRPYRLERRNAGLLPRMYDEDDCATVYNRNTLEYRVCTFALPASAIAYIRNTQQCSSAMERLLNMYQYIEPLLELDSD